MQLNKRPIVHLTARINGIDYVIGTLRFQKDKELSYFFLDPRSSINKHLNCDSGIMDSPPEHITWHSDRVHIKRKDNKAIEVLYYSNGPLITDSPIVTPIYVESIYFDGQPCLIKLSEFVPFKDSYVQEILRMDSPQGLSVIFVLVPDFDSTHSILTGLQFEDVPGQLSRNAQLGDLLDSCHGVGRIKLWDNWDMLVIITPFVCRISPPVPNPIKPTFRLLNYTNVPSALTDLIMQAAVSYYRVYLLNIMRLIVYNKRPSC